MHDFEWVDDDPGRRARRDGTRIPPQTSVNELDIPVVLNALPSYESADGALPPLLHTEQWRQMYLDIVQDVCQRQVDTR